MNKEWKDWIGLTHAEREKERKRMYWEAVEMETGQTKEQIIEHMKSVNVKRVEKMRPIKKKTDE